MITNLMMEIHLAYIITYIITLIKNKNCLSVDRPLATPIVKRLRVDVELLSNLVF